MYFLVMLICFLWLGAFQWAGWCSWVMLTARTERFWVALVLQNLRLSVRMFDIYSLSEDQAS